NTNSLKAAALLATHEHQDAQELFQLLSECVREESVRVGREGGEGSGVWVRILRSRAGGESSSAGERAGQSPFDGLTATRRACVRCGYTAAIRHFAFDSVQLALETKLTSLFPPRQTTLPALLRAYTALEVLHDCPCRRAAAADKEKDKEKEKNGTTTITITPTVTASRLRRLKAVRRMEARVRRALEAGRIEEEELEGEIERVAGGVCTRQSMIGRPPPALHINRSVHTGLRVARNDAIVAFPELLDLAPYTTSGVLNLDPTVALSGTTLNPSEQVAFPTNTNAVDDGTSVGDEKEECLYRLAAAVCHYGQHSFGHYICYRRAPVPVPSSSSSSLAPTPTPSTQAGHVPAPPTREGSAGTGTGWLRISDARVERCGVEQVLSEGSAVFMLYYERVPPPPP
ncbi:hypothetical protein B0H13DRAFT_1562220, partial [Mycena leptocephala]